AFARGPPPFLRERVSVGRSSAPAARHRLAPRTRRHTASVLRGTSIARAWIPQFGFLLRRDGRSDRLDPNGARITGIVESNCPWLHRGTERRKPHYRPRRNTGDTMRYFEDFNSGDVFELGEAVIAEAEILEFARKYDPQPFHVDKEAAARSMFKGLVASGWHTGSIFMGLLVRGLFCDSASVGSGGLDELRWLAPVRPGDVLRGRMTVLSRKESERHRERGTVVGLGELFKQRSERVFFIRWLALIGLRH